MNLKVTMLTATMWFLLLPCPADSAIPAVIATIGLNILKGFGSTIGGLASEAAFEALGFVSDESLDRIAEQLDTLQDSVDEIDSKLDDQSFKSALSLAMVTAGHVQTESSIVQRWYDSGIVPSNDEVSDVQRELLQSMEEFRVHVTDPETGVLARFTKVDRYAKVSNNIEYEEDLEDLRTYFVNAVGSAVATTERMARILDTAARNCAIRGRRLLRGGGGDEFQELAQDDRRALQSQSTYYEGRANHACRHDSSGLGSALDPLTATDTYFDVATNIFSLTACQAACDEREECIGVEFGDSLNRCELWKMDIGWMGPYSGFSCYKKRIRDPNAPQPTKTTIYEGTHNTACRLDTTGLGSASDPLAVGTSNAYFDVDFDTFTLQACQDKCTAKDECVGIEYGSAANRCELWKQEIGWKESFTGYGCYTKVTSEPSSQATNNCDIATISDTALNDFFQDAKRLARDMYSYGIPFVETRVEENTDTVYEGTHNSACRLDTTGLGSSNDPLANGSSNKYFDVVSASSLQGCQAKCTARSSCVGIEYGSETKRCELWKLEIGWKEPYPGFGCYRKRDQAAVSEATSYEVTIGTVCRLDRTGLGSSSDPATSTNIYYDAIAANTLQRCLDACTDRVSCVGVEFGSGLSRCELWKQEIGWAESFNNEFGCYKKVVTLPPVSSTPIVHLTDQTWAISAETDSSSGYYETLTTNLWEDRLTTLHRAYDDGDRSFERFLQDSNVSTNYIDHYSWYCSVELGGGSFGGDPTAYFLSVKIMQFNGDSESTKKVYLASFGADGSGACQKLLVGLRSATNTGGLHISTYFNDNEMCNGGSIPVCIPGLFNPVNVNAKFYSRVFWYDLSVSDCQRMCTVDECPDCGPYSSGCSYCGRRLDGGGHRALLSEAAVTDFVGLSTASPSILEASPPAATWQQMFFNDFETGLQDFNDGGKDAARRSDFPRNGGQWSLRIRDNTSTSIVYTNSLDVSAYTDMRVTFFYRGKGMENNKDFFLEYSSDGSDYVQAGRWISGTDFNNGEWKEEAVTFQLPPGTNSIVLRFRNDAARDNDQIYLDDIELEGLLSP